MNTAVLALASAASWGSSDFLGGVSARRISPYQTVAVAHTFSLVCTLAALFLLHEPFASSQTMSYGLAAGLFGGGGLVIFYAALAAGSMGLTAALAGVLTAAVPVLYGLLTEGLPRAHQLAGFVLAVVAIWLIAAAPSSTTAKTSTRSLWFGAIAGLCFGIYFVLLKLSSSAGGQGLDHTGNGVAPILWSMVFSRVTSAALALVLCLRTLRSNAQTCVWDRHTFALAAAVGILDTGGNLLYMFAAHLGRVDIAAILSSLYPAMTILLAALVLHERTSRTQTVGMALALGAVGLIAS